MPRFARPDDRHALGWAIVNRIGATKRRGTLNDVLFEPTQYSFAPSTRHPLGSSQWQKSANPAAMAPADKASFEAAQRTADGILTGMIPDPTGGATHYFTSDRYNGDWRTARDPWFQKVLHDDTLGRSSYKSKSKLEKKNYFFIPGDR